MAERLLYEKGILDGAAGELERVCAHIELLYVHPLVRKLFTRTVCNHTHPMQSKVRRPACERDRRRRSLTYAVVSTLGTSKNDQTDLTYLLECARSVSGEHCRDQYEDGRLARRCTSGFGRTHPSSRTRCVRGTKGRVETCRRERSGGTEAVGATEPATSVSFNNMRL